MAWAALAFVFVLCGFCSVSLLAVGGSFCGLGFRVPLCGVGAGCEKKAGCAKPLFYGAALAQPPTRSAAAPSPAWASHIVN